jgi:hypothetical protein
MSKGRHDKNKMKQFKILKLKKPSSQKELKFDLNWTPSPTQRYKLML